MTVVRIKTSTGWQDLVVAGPSDSGKTRQVTKLVSTANTATLGGTFVNIPGLLASGLTLKANIPVVLTGGVTLQWISGSNVPTAFFASRLAGSGTAGWTYYQPGGSGRNVTTGIITVPIGGLFIPTADGSYDIGVFAQAGGGSGTGIGASGASWALIDTIQ
jgi:hypothetical protein